MTLPTAAAYAARRMTLVNDAVHATLHEPVGRDVERGLQAATYRDGELVLDAWAGLADATTGRAVDGATLFVGFSCGKGKGILATDGHLLAGRGQIDYDAPVATYWPEFASRGKDAITVRRLCAHQDAPGHQPRLARTLRSRR